MHLEKVKLKIADIVIILKSRFPQEDFSGPDAEAAFSQRFKNFLYNGNRKSNIVINVEIVNKLPRPRRIKSLFIVYHPTEGKNWRLSRKGEGYIFRNFAQNKEQVMVINRAFDRVNAYLLPKKDNRFVWDFTDIVYDFLQVLLINYFAQRGAGIFIHGVGIKDVDGRGYVFAGKSGAGKTTTAKIWYRHSRAKVLNDDRIIVRKTKKKFFVHGSPWHGAFSDYLTSLMESSSIGGLFFLYHCSKNKLKSVSPEKAFKLLYPTIFPTFWDKDCLEKMISFCQDLVRVTPCFRLGFMKSKKVIKFVRNSN